jgi:hypothetical protein
MAPQRPACHNVAGAREKASGASCIDPPGFFAQRWEQDGGTRTHG